MQIIKAVVLAVVLTACAAASPFSSLYFFGDSLSDTGNVYNTTKMLHDGTFGLVPVLPDSPPYFNGHFSNGQVWTEYVAANLGQPTAAKPAGMSLGLLGQYPGSGNNYAIGGAKTGYGGALGAFDFLIPTGVRAQTEYYLSKTGGVADPNALYFVLGGGNDLLAAAEMTDPNQRISSTIESVTHLGASIYTLYSAGARNFMVVNAPNIGLVPDSFQNNRVEAAMSASLTFNYVLDYYYFILGALPGMNMMYFDLYTLYEEVLVDTLTGGQAFGFTSLTPCMNPGPGVPPCDATVFFDSIHPTTKMHSIFASRVTQYIEDYTNPRRVITLSSDALDAPVSVSAVPEPAHGIAVAGLVLIAMRRYAVRKRRSVR